MTNEQFFWTVFLATFVALMAHTVNVFTDPGADKDDDESNY